MKNNEMSDAGLKQQRAEDEAARVRAMETVHRSLRELAANLMRIVRGAGEPQRVRQQADALIASMVAYRNVVGHLPSSYEIGAALMLDSNPEWLAGLSEESGSRVHAKTTDALLLSHFGRAFDACYRLADQDGCGGTRPPLSNRRSVAVREQTTDS